MNFDQIEKIANAVLYEGYNLYPYRPSARKNQRRWTFGRVYPQAYSLAQNGAEPWLMQAQLLVATQAGADGLAPNLTVKLRFLQIVDRQIGQLVNPLPAWPATGEPEFQRVRALSIGETMYHTWQEGLEQSFDISPVSLADIIEGFLQKSFSCAAARTVEPIHKAPQEIVGVIVRQKQAQRGLIELTAEPLGADLFKVTVQVKNISPLENAGQQTEQTVLPATFASTHLMLGVENGRFLSLTAPPAAYREAAAACENIGLWPVLVGDAESPEMMLASPIILYDYPQVAPESAGDFFDGTEIDEMLALRVLTLTDEEKREMAQVDEFARKILERTEAFPEEQLLKLHGTWREPGRPSPEEVNPWDFLGENTRLEAIAVKGVYFKAGDRVRLKPRGGADAFDLILAGQTAIIEAIEQDFEDNIHLAVVLDADPGQDLGFMRQPGHRFFFAPEEVELLSKQDAPENE